MIDRVQKVHDLKPERLIADTAYGSGPMLDWLVKRRAIAPHIPVIDKSGRKDGTFERADFTYDGPNGKELRQYRRAFKTPRSGSNKDETIRYRARKSDCDVCALKERCTPKEPQRKVTRSIYEASRDVARALSQTPQYAISRKLRKKVEMSFAHLKRIHGLGRLRLRGPCGAHDEFLLAAASVHVAMTARIAGDMGFRAAMLGGSVAALAVIGAPDRTLLSLDELAGLCRRICRPGALPLIVDADHGFGNALNAMRTVEELEHAGVACVSIEDTDLPQPHGGGGTSLVSVAEARAKISAAVAGRRDPALVIAARTDARLQDDENLSERARAFAAEGADAIFLSGVRRVRQVEVARVASGLPIMLAGRKDELETADLGALGIRICLQGHRTFTAALRAAWESLAADEGASRTEAP